MTAASTIYRPELVCIHLRVWLLSEAVRFFIARITPEWHALKVLKRVFHGPQEVGHVCSSTLPVGPPRITRMNTNDRSGAVGRISCPEGGSGATEGGHSVRRRPIEGVQILAHRHGATEAWNTCHLASSVSVLSGALVRKQYPYGTHPTSNQVFQCTTTIDKPVDKLPRRVSLGMTLYSDSLIPHTGPFARIRGSLSCFVALGCQRR